MTDPSYREKIERLRSVSKKYNGIQRCSEIIESYT
jgi:hypothetical protein